MPVVRTCAVVALALLTAVASAVALAPRAGDAQPRRGAAASRRDAGAIDAAVDAALPEGGVADPDADTRAGAAVALGDDAGLDPDAAAFEARRASAAAAFAEGVDAYRRGDYLRAADRFEAAYRYLPHPVPLYNAARSLEGANDIRGAIAAYERYLAVAPTDADRVEVRERLALLRARPAQITISSEPAGASVYLDEQTDPLAETTTIHNLPVAPGPHIIQVELEGYRRAVRRFVVPPGGSQTLIVTLQRDGAGGGAGSRWRIDPRVLNRRSATLFSPQFSFLLGAARPWSGLDFRLAVGAEATLFVGRHLAARLHFERVEPDGLWTIVTGDVGGVYALDDLDLSLYAAAGAAYGWMRPEDFSARAPQQLVVVAGAELRVDWMFHRYLAVGAFFRALWRNFFVAQIEFLNSFGLSFSLHL